jgi:hypothetical protein
MGLSGFSGHPFAMRFNILEQFLLLPQHHKLQAGKTEGKSIYHFPKIYARREASIPRRSLTYDSTPSKYASDGYVMGYSFTSTYESRTPWFMSLNLQFLGFKVNPASLAPTLRLSALQVQ